MYPGLPTSINERLLQGMSVLSKDNVSDDVVVLGFLKRHEETLSSNPRLSLAMGSCRKRSEEKQAQDAQVAADVMAALGMTAPAIAAGDPSK